MKKIKLQRLVLQNFKGFTFTLEESGKVIDNSLKLLNQEIEKKISPASKEK